MITANEIKRFGPVILALFLRRFPNGATREELEQEAETHEWARKLLDELRKEG